MSTSCKAHWKMRANIGPCRLPHFGAVWREGDLIRRSNKCREAYGQPAVGQPWKPSDPNPREPIMILIRGLGRPWSQVPPTGQSSCSGLINYAPHQEIGRSNYCYHSAFGITELSSQDVMEVKVEKENRKARTPQSVLSVAYLCLSARLVRPNASPRRRDAADFDSSQGRLANPEQP